jgi:uncharacterized protein YjbI with pentapeptide repeats
MGKKPNNQQGQKPRTVPPAAGQPSGLANASPIPVNCNATVLTSEARAISDGVMSIATNIGKVTATPSLLSRLWTFAKFFTWVGGTIIGALFGIETFFQHQQENYRNQADALFNSSREQLASEQAAIRANAVRSLPPLARFQNIVQSQPSDYFVGSHLLNRFWYNRTEMPLKRQAWTLFREFAQQPRVQKATNTDEVDIVSSALLQEGVAWEKRMQMERATPSVDMSGSLLFKARLSNAKANGLDCSRTSFGATDLKFANLPSCIFDDCNLVRAALDGALFNNARLSGASLSEASATKADFSFAKCSKTVFRKSVMAYATFTQTVLDGADFSGAILDGASFSQANVQAANFSGASLRKTIFSQVDVSTASFDAADVEGADFTSAFGVSKALLDRAKNSDKVLLPSDITPTTDKP